MTCREAERLVMPYINGELTDAELAEFLKHIDTCEDCREELEIYFTVDVGIRQLDEAPAPTTSRGPWRRPWRSHGSGFTPSICCRRPGTR